MAKRISPKKLARKRDRQRARHSTNAASVTASTPDNEASVWNLDAISGRGTVAASHGQAALILMDGGIGERVAENYKGEGFRSGVVPGDRVSVEVSDGASKISSVLPRRTTLSRLRADSNRRGDEGAREHVIAANVDTALIVASTASPPFRPSLVDRYLIICQNGEVTPFLCVNKIDLAAPDSAALETYLDVGVQIAALSAIDGDGIDELRARVAGQTVVLVGHSGVGKSSIANALMGESLQAVGEVGLESRGRHTTTASRLIEWAEGSFLIDTPGIRSLGLWEVDAATLGHYFPEFQEYAPTCRYRDCSHDQEPGCEVKAAVESGDVNRGRYDSYIRLLNE